jgi:Flp pilus assembly protein TadD
MIIALPACSTSPSKQADTEAKKEAGPYKELYKGDQKVVHETEKSFSSFEEAVQRGDQALAEGAADKALFAYVQALQISGGDAETLNKIGEIHIQTNNFTLATRAFDESLKLSPDNSGALEGLGLIYLRQRDYEQAKVNLTKAVQQEPDRWRAHNALGMVADLQGDFVTAVYHYNEALKQEPNSPELLNNLGYSLYLAGDWDGALRNYRKALNFDPNYQRVWQNMGLVYTRQGNFDAAVDAFRRIMDKPKAYNNVGYLCMINGDYANAEKFFRLAIKQSPTFYEKAQENLDRVHRLREQDTSTSY